MSETLHPTSLLIGIVLAFGAGLWQRARAAPGEAFARDRGRALCVLRRRRARCCQARCSIFTCLIASHRGLPNVLVIMTVLIALYAFITRRTVIGRQIYAVGGNAKAAKLSGIKTERLTFLTFVNMGVLAALAGLVFAARLNTATPKAGIGFELDVIAACFIGGASAYGGVGRVGGGGGRRHDHGRHEQRDVDPRHRHRLSAGDQGPGAARGRLHRCL